MRYFKSAAFLLAIVSSSVPSLSRTAMAAEEPDTQQSTENKPTGADLASLLDGAQHEPILSERRSSPVSSNPVSSNPVFSNPVSSNEVTSESSSASNSASTFTLSSPTAGHEPNFFQRPAQQNAPTLSQAAGEDTEEGTTGEDLPTLEEDTPPPAQTAPDILPGGTPASPTRPGAEAGPTSPAAEPGSGANPAPPAAEPSGKPTNEPANEPGNASPSEEPNGGAASEVEINELPDSLLSDPNPLSVPASTEEIDIERNPVVTLEQAIELAYRNNQALQQALLTLQQAETALQEANASQLPTVSVGANLTNQQQGSQESTTLGGSLEVGYDLLTGGQRSASIRAAEIQSQVSALAVEAQQEQIRLDTANLYYALQEAGEQIRINQSFVNEAERNLRDSELRQEVGVGTRFDVLRADVQLANARQELVQSRFNQDIARRDISRQLNLPSTAGLQATAVAKAEPWPLDLEESILLAFENRSELEQQLLQADLSEQQRQIALSATRPQVSLFANYGLDTVLTSSQGGEGELNDSTSFGARFNMSLFDGGAARARARGEEISGEIAEEQFSEQLDQIRFDVEQSFFNLQANEENIATSRVAVAQAEEALNLANLRLQAGVGTQLDVLSAQSELTQAQVNNVTAILGYNRALAGLQRAVSNLEE